MRGIDPNATIIDRVMFVLRQTPNGMTSAQILQNINETGLPNLQRESLSPQLSRLRGDNFIELENGIWRIKKNEEANDDFSDLI